MKDDMPEPEDVTLDNDGPTLEDEAYERGVTDERTRLIDWLKAVPRWWQEDTSGETLERLVELLEEGKHVRGGRYWREQ